jgi:hypothetical protein
MRLSSSGKGLVASAVMLCATIAFSCAVIYDHLTAEPADLPAETAIETTGRPVRVRVGDTSLEAESFRLDPLLHQPHALSDVVIRMPDYSVKAQSAAIPPKGGGLSLRDADLLAEGLTGRMGVLTMQGRRIFFENVRAHGSLIPLHVTRFEVGRMSIPERSLGRKGFGLGDLVGGVSGGKAPGKKRGRQMEFGFGRLEIVLTVLFQRGLIRRGFLNLPDGKTRVRFRRGMYTAKHRKVYMTDTVVTRGNVRLTAEDAEIRMKDGELVLLPPVEQKVGERTETLRTTFKIDLE